MDAVSGSWVVLGLLSALFAALVAIFGKIGLQDVDPIAATAARSIIMALVVAAIALASGKIGGLQAVSSRAWLMIGLSGVAGAASWLAYFAALQLGQASGVSALDRLSVVFVVVLSFLVLGEPFSASKLAGAGFIVVGALLITR